MSLSKYLWLAIFSVLIFLPTTSYADFSYEIPYTLDANGAVYCDTPPYLNSINFNSYQIAKDTTENVVFKSPTRGNGFCFGNINAGTKNFGNFDPGNGQLLDGNAGIYYLIPYLDGDYQEAYGYMAFDCPVEGLCTPLKQTNTVTYSGDVTENTTWTKDNNPYIVDQLYITNGATLTIESGVIIKFRNSISHITVGSTSSLNINGTEEEKVYLTSISDDTLIGDTNLDNDKTIARKGSWGNVKFNNNSLGDLKHIVLKYSKYGIHNQNGVVHITDSEFIENDSYGLIQIGGDTNINHSKFTNNQYGVYQNSGNVIIRNSLISNNTLFGVFGTVDAINNFWGDATGPYHDTNQSGLGNAVSDNVSFDPWLTTDPFFVPEPCTIDCNSSVMFFPGIQGSRLYEELLQCGDLLSIEYCGEEELWVATDPFLQERMLLDNSGKSLNNVFTKNDTENTQSDGREDGIVSEVASLNIYKSFLDDLRDWKEEERIIEDYAFIPYDWRLSLEDIVTNGKVQGENLVYTQSQEFSESFVLKQLEELQESSRTGKVTLIGHSKGGLVIKALLQKLKETNNPLYAKIDKVIFVASPQVGTPEAIIGLLHGLKLGKGFIMPAETSRYLGENMPGLYALLPSEKYFETVLQNNLNNVPVTFDGDTMYEKQIAEYGFVINSFQELSDFMLGQEGRTKPEKDDIKNPNVMNEYLYNQAKDIHNWIDGWVPEGDTKVIQIAGWGEETIAGIDYVVRNNKLSYKKRGVMEGDGTVVVPSALYLNQSANVENWWVDLIEFNQLNLPLIGIDRDHKDILEVKPLRNLIKSKVTDSIFEDNLNVVLSDGSQLVSNLEKIVFTLHSPLTLGVYDEQGRYTGLDPIAKEIKEEIPNVKYWQIGEVQTLSIPKGIKFSLKLEGYEQGQYALDIDNIVNGEILESTLFEFLETTEDTIVTLDISEGFDVQNVKLQIDTNSDGTIDETYPKEEVVEEETEDDPIVEEEAETPVVTEENTPQNPPSTQAPAPTSGVVNIFLTNTSPQQQVQTPVLENTSVQSEPIEQRGEVLGEETVAKEEIKQEVPVISNQVNLKEEIPEQIQKDEEVLIEEENTQEGKEQIPMDEKKERNSLPYYVIISVVIGIIFIKLKKLYL